MNNQGFFNRVYEVVKEVPYGRITTYGAIAAYLGSKGAARMVGWALNGSYTSGENIPAHRVVNRSGLLTGKRHFGGTEVMKQLLESEGVIVEEDRITRFDELFWDPAEHL
ncbi:MAG TPA: MGMT family protein [Bacteroidetes bacterium]|nr:MGMT family protein [Bacteroidota bacterium]